MLISRRTRFREIDEEDYAMFRCEYGSACEDRDNASLREKERDMISTTQ